MPFPGRGAWWCRCALPLLLLGLPLLTHGEKCSQESLGQRLPGMKPAAVGPPNNCTRLDIVPGPKAVYVGGSAELAIEVNAGSLTFSTDKCPSNDDAAWRALAQYLWSQSVVWYPNVPSWSCDGGLQKPGLGAAQGSDPNWMLVPLTAASSTAGVNCGTACDSNDSCMAFLFTPPSRCVYYRQRPIAAADLACTDCVLGLRIRWPFRFRVLIPGYNASRWPPSLLAAQLQAQLDAEGVQVTPLTSVSGSGMATPRSRRLEQLPQLSTPADLELQGTTLQPPSSAAVASALEAVLGPMPALSVTDSLRPGGGEPLAFQPVPQPPSGPVRTLLRSPVTSPAAPPAASPAPTPTRSPFPKVPAASPAPGPTPSPRLQPPVASPAPTLNPSPSLQPPPASPAPTLNPSPRLQPPPTSPASSPTPSPIPSPVVLPPASPAPSPSPPLELPGQNASTTQAPATTPPAEGASTSSSSGGGGSHTGTIAGAVVGGVVGVALLGMLVLLVVRHRRARYALDPPCTGKAAGCLSPGPGPVLTPPPGDKVVRVVHICPDIDPPSGFLRNELAFCGCQWEGCKAPKSLHASADMSPYHQLHSHSNIERVLSEAVEKLVAHQESSNRPLARLGSKPLYRGMTLRRLFGLAARGPREPADYQGQVSWIRLEELSQQLDLTLEDPFIKTAAAKYSWSLDPVAGCHAVEAPVSQVLEHDGTMDPRPSKLTAREVAAQLQLMAQGCVYKGPHSLVFKARWPQRFGPHALVAVKVLRDPRGFDADDLRAAYRQEAQVLASCRHPSVVRLYGYCLDGPTACLITELLPHTLETRLYGTHTGQHVHAASSAHWGVADGAACIKCSHAGDAKHAPGAPLPKPLTQAEVVQIGTDIAAGLAQLHARAEPRSRRTSLEVLKEEDSAELGAQAAGQASGRVQEGTPKGSSGHLAATASDLEAGAVDQDGMSEDEDVGPMGTAHKTMRVVHYDLQPCNILLTSSGRAKITGFGFQAKQAIESEDQHECITYRPPEMLSGYNASRAKDKVDVYSLGMILWEMAAHRRPCEGCTNEEITHKVCCGERPPLPGGSTPWKPSTAALPSGSPPDQLVENSKGQDKSAGDHQDSSGWDKPLAAAAASHAKTTAGGKGPDVPQLLVAQPQLASLIRQCWLPQPARRPTAAAMLKTLLQLQMRLDTPPRGHTPKGGSANSSPGHPGSSRLPSRLAAGSASDTPHTASKLGQ